MRKFYSGDIVQLKSGGPEMTVSHYNSNIPDDKKIICTWFDKNNELKSATFIEDQLQSI